jgi:hypothetical protein
MVNNITNQDNTNNPFCPTSNSNGQQYNQPQQYK